MTSTQRLSALLLMFCACAAPSANQKEAPPIAAAAPFTPFKPVAVQLPSIPDKRFVVTEFGAKGDGTTNDTPAINKAIDAAHAAGGGTVVFPAAEFMGASIQLKSNVRLLLEAGSTIRGLKEGYLPPEDNQFSKFQDFGHSHFHNALIWGENVSNVAIEGPGTIDGGGVTTGDPKAVGVGDKQIAIKKGERLLFRNLTQTHGGHFFYLLTDTRELTMENLKMSKGRDGIDLMGVTNANLHDISVLDVGDDTIALKSDFSLGRRIDSANVAVWNATVETNCNGLQFGSETAGDFRNISFWHVKVLRAGKAGIGIQSNDGAVIENVSFDDITIENAINPIFINTTKRMRTPEPRTPGRVRNILIRNVTASASTIPDKDMHASTISGLPGVPHEDITLENVTITYKGGGKYEDGNAHPAFDSKNYNPRALGVRPAYGFFLRHAKGLKLKNVKVTFQAEDLRPAVVAWDVDGLELVGVSAQRAAAGSWASVRVGADVKNLRLQDSPQLAEPVVAAMPSGPPNPPVP